MQKKLINIYLILSACMFFVDRITKYLALNYLDSFNIINRFLKFELILNRGISFGLFDSQSPIVFSLVTLMVILITLYLGLYSINRFKDNNLIFGETLILTGSVSNILDRILHGGVIDFVAVNISDFIPGAFFNLSDVFISLGVLIVFVQFYKVDNLDMQKLNIKNK